MCDKLDNDSKIMQLWMNRIKNKYKELYKSNKKSNQILQQAINVENVDNNLDNFKVKIDKTFKLIDSYPEKFQGKVYIAAYSVNNILIKPFLEYLLLKNPEYHKTEPNQLYFPFFESDIDLDIEEEADLLLKQIFNKSKHIIEYKGYCKINNNCYLIYDTGSRKYNPKEKSSSSFWWWTSLHEIIDSGFIYNFKINQSVKELFYYEPGLSRLTTIKGKLLQNPIIAYQHEPIDDIKKNILFGPTRTLINEKGIFLVFTQIERAKKLAYLSLSYPFTSLKNEPNYIDYQSNYCLLRFALFINDSILLSREQFENNHNLKINNKNTIIIDCNENYNIDEDDMIFLIKEDERCFFMNYVKLSINHNLKYIHNSYNYETDNDESDYDNENIYDDLSSESSDVILVNNFQ